MYNKKIALNFKQPLLRKITIMTTTKAVISKHNLSTLRKNQSATISKIDVANIPHNLKINFNDIEAKLLEMGFIEGAKIKVLHKGAFGGDPIAVRIDNANRLVSLRKHEANAILINDEVS